MKINKAYKFRLYPSKSQIKYIEGCFNACRYVYNVSLDCEQQLYDLGAKSNLSTIGLGYHLKKYKITQPWLKNYDSIAYLMEMESLNKAFMNFFKGQGYPKFKAKSDVKQSFRLYGKGIKIIDGKIRIPKIDKTIKCKMHREIEGKIRQFIISRKNDKYYVSIMTEINKEIKPVKIKKEVGIDLGVKTFLTRDDGNIIENPEFLKNDAKHLAKLQANFAKAKRGSKNREKLKKKIANLHEKISNKRNNFLHNVSYQLTEEFDRVYMETLVVKSMTKSAKGTLKNPGVKVKNKSNLNKRILDIGLQTFTTMVEYKNKSKGKETVKVDRFYPSSKTCNKCGAINKNLKLSDRIWTCPSCGEELDRDDNAAKNIKAEGRRSLIEK